ncbi:MAG: 16S rRNA (cytosine(967)-C(5))-methyltransferase RsmB [Clostridia bacterium]|nr:16S rRNA (cytosine(967)-C(5))-methyltransferase RsmB [Clostridia bacterium]
MDNPRKMALASLVKADSVSSFSNIEVSSVISRSKLEKNDAALYTALYMGVTERLLTLDHIISSYSKTPIEKIDTETKNAIRLGLYQLCFMDKIPDYSAVSETVELCPKRSKGFVNAILRSFIRDNKKISYPNDKWKALSLKTSIPVAVLDIFKNSYGEGTAKKIAMSSSFREGISLRVNTLKNTTEELCRLLDNIGAEYTVNKYCSDIVKTNATVTQLKNIIDTGCAFVQDTASRITTKIFGAKCKESVLDACACPGGKSFSVAIDMNNEGELISCDLHKNKLSLVENGAKRLGINIITTKEQNGKSFVPEFEKHFDRVLCDVPCSGLGVISKKPDIKYKDVASIYALPSIQYEILQNCSKYVKVGGEIVYSTCTLNKKENEDVVRAFLEGNDSFESVEFELDDIKSSGGMYTFFTHINSTDGFFVAKMKRVK